MGPGKRQTVPFLFPIFDLVSLRYMQHLDKRVIQPANLVFKGSRFRTGRSLARCLRGIGRTRGLGTGNVLITFSDCQEHQTLSVVTLAGSRIALSMSLGCLRSKISFCDRFLCLPSHFMYCNRIAQDSMPARVSHAGINDEVAVLSEPCFSAFSFPTFSSYQSPILQATT